MNRSEKTLLFNSEFWMSQDFSDDATAQGTITHVRSCTETRETSVLWM